MSRWIPVSFPATLERLYSPDVGDYEYDVEVDVEATVYRGGTLAGGDDPSQIEILAVFLSGTNKEVGESVSKEDNDILKDMAYESVRWKW